MERGRPLAPQERQELERVLQQRVALGAGWEVPAVGRVLLLEPAQPQAADRPAAREHVERGRDLPEVGDVAVGDARDHRAEPDPLRRRGQEAERGPALQHVLPGLPHPRDLAEVVHDPQALEARLLGRRGDLPEVAGDLGRAARPREAGELQAEAHRRPLARPRRVRRPAPPARRVTGPGGWTAANPSSARASRTAGQPLQLRAHDRRRDGRAPRPVPRPDLGRRDVEGDGEAGDAGRLGQRAVAGPLRRVERERVDDRRDAPAQALLHDGVEQGEGVLRRRRCRARRRRPAPAARRSTRPGGPGTTRRAHVDLPDAAGPTSTTRQGDGRVRVGGAADGGAIERTLGPAGRRPYAGAHGWRCG